MSVFARTSGPWDADILVVGEAFGADEARLGKPLVGVSGQEFTRILTDANLSRQDLLLTNIINAKPPGNDFTYFLYPTKSAPPDANAWNLNMRPPLREAVYSLQELIKRVQPKLIIGLGNYPMWILSGAGKVSNRKGYKVPSGIMNWRGSQLETSPAFGSIPFLPIIHPAAIVRQWDWRFTTVHDLRTRVPLALGGKWEAPQQNFLAPPTFVEAKETLQALIDSVWMEPQVLAVDLETYSRELITCLGIAWNTQEAISIPFIKIEKNSVVPYWTEAEELELKRLLRTLLTHKHTKIVGQNFLYDLQWFPREMGFLPGCEMDTMLAHHLLFPGTPKALHNLSALYCDYHRYWKDESQEWSVKEFGLDQLLIYNCKDCCATWEIGQVLQNQILMLGLSEQFEHQMDQFQLALKMMFRGVKIDTKHRFTMKQDLIVAIQELESWFNYVMPVESSGKVPWFRSPKQLASVLYEQFAMTPVRSRMTGSLTTNNEAIETLMDREPIFRPFFERLLMYRSLGVFHRTFISAALDPDHRMRCSFNVGGTHTFRWSSSHNAFGRGTNLQNIPKGDKEE